MGEAGGYEVERLDPYPAMRPGTVVQRARARWRDGTALITFGVFLIGAVLADTARWVVATEDGVAVFPWLTAAGLVSLLAGYGQRRVRRRAAQAGVTVAVWDPDGAADGPDLADRAVQYSRQVHDLTLDVREQLTDDAAANLPIAERVRRRTTFAIRVANRFMPYADRVNLIPMMRLHIGFWLGTRLGRSPATPVGLLAPTGPGEGQYFLAALLARPVPALRQPKPVPALFEPSVDPLTDRVPARVALAVSLQPRGGSVRRAAPRPVQGR